VKQLFTQLITILQENNTLLLWLGAFSVLCFLATAIAVPWVVISLPDNYFVTEKRSSVLTQNFQPFVALLLMFLKNCLALVIVAAGLVMLVIPGQGLLTVLIGVLMLDFPGKYKVERWIVRNQTVLSSINWLRRRKGKNALEVEE
jgi:ABC-type multidrug transport system fused ATPase/permease subunit